MEKYIEGNKAAWEEAFDNRDSSWGTDIVGRVLNEEYPLSMIIQGKKLN